MAETVVLGIDIGGSLTKIGLVTKEGSILDKTVFKTESQKPFPFFFEKLKSEVEKLISNLPPNVQVLSIGVGAPNANPYTGMVENPPNLKWGERTPVATVIEKAFKLPVSLANDANAAALGEMLFGAAKGMKNFVTLTLGTGLGSGIVVHGKLVIGEHGAAGELGHVNVNPNGRSCNCGLQGCLETYASVTGIRRTVFELLANMREDSILRSFSFEELSGTAISAAALEGDPIALKAFEETGIILGSKMADTVAHVDPEAFILSGGLSKAGDILLNPIKTSMERKLFKAYKGKVAVVLATATGADAILGPAALAWLEAENIGLT
ncbi:ROK family protein [Maribacter chungangensis]|uniref:ROK family protein n=1 Tax=Maribacter chungangensis TaxID=1069117 RepID=A0ABW3B290_9FLAO